MKPDFRLFGLMALATTQNFLTDYRQSVTFLAVDRPLTPDIEASYRFLRQYPRQ